MKINLVELELKVFLLKNIKNEQALEKISKLVDKTLIKSEKYATLHNKNTYKYYSFSSLWPIEKKKTYLAGNIYSVRIRTVDLDLAKYLENNLSNEYTESIKALTLTKRYIPQRHIEKIYSITPCIAKFEEGYWRGKYSLETYETRIKNNIIKKYNSYFNTKLEEDFDLFNMIKFDNKKPISSTYKEMSILGDKLTLHLAENKIAQDLAYFMLGTGLLEMSSRGYGFVNHKWI